MDRDLVSTAEAGDSMAHAEASMVGHTTDDASIDDASSQKRKFSYIADVLVPNQPELGHRVEPDVACSVSKGHADVRTVLVSPSPSRNFGKSDSGTDFGKATPAVATLPQPAPAFPRHIRLGEAATGGYARRSRPAD